MERPGCDIWHGLSGSGLHDQPPFGKIQACPRKLAALQQGIFTGSQFFLGDELPGGKSLLAQDDFCPGSLAGGQGGEVRGPDRALQPEQQGEKQKQPGPEPPAAQQRPQPEKQPVPFLNAEPDPVPAGQPGKL